MLVILTAVRWIKANWKLITIIAILGGAFYSGWATRGYIAEAAQNKAIAAAVKASEDKMRGDYEKAAQIEKRKRAIREKARAANTDIYSAGGDNCSDKPIPSDFMRLIQSAYDNIAG